MPHTLKWSPLELELHVETLGCNTILATQPTTAHQRLVWSRAALTSGKPAAMRRGIELLASNRTVLGRGLQMILAAQMGESREVLKAELPPVAVSELDRYGACWWRFARALALTQACEFTEALMELGRAAELASSLGLRDRLQLIELHLRYIEVEMGRGKPSKIQQELELDLPAPRRAWHSGNNFAASLLQRGHYDRVLTTIDPNSYYHALASALTGQRYAGTGTTSYHRVAKAWEALWYGRPVDSLTGLRSRLMGMYARLACGIHLSRTPQGAQLVTRIIRNEPPSAPDQAALWAATTLQAFARGGSVATPLAATRILNEALSDLEDAQTVLTVIQRLLPEALLIASYGPRPHPELVYTGLELAQRTRREKVGHVVTGYRMQDVHSEPGRAPNMGVVLSGIDRLAEVAVDEERHELERQWRMAREKALWDAAPKEQELLRHESHHCARGHIGCTLEA